MENLTSTRSYRSKVSAADRVELRFDKAPGPSSAMIEIADRCNEACVHCYQVQGKKGEMTTAELKRVMDELHTMGVLFLTLSGGEPTLRPDFVELVEYARKLRFAVKIYSNGLRIDERLARRLGELAVQEVQISLYSHRAEIHDAVTRVPGSFERTVAAVRHLRTAGVAVVLKSPLMSLNQEETSAYVAWVSALGAEYSLDSHMSPREDGGQQPLAVAVDKEAYFALRNHPAFALPEVEVEPPALDTAPCRACKASLHIEANGELRPCTQWSVPTGHCLDEGVQDAWKNNPAAQTIRGLTWNDLPACRTCDLRQHCTRCFSDARSYAGDALAPYARACREAAWSYELKHGTAPHIEPNSEGATAVGPYRNVGTHRFEVTRAEPTAQDRATAEMHPFLREAPSACPTPPASPQAGVGQLVQLRRPKPPPLTERGSGPSSKERQTIERSPSG